MPLVARIKFDSSSRVYYFDPKELELKKGDHVIVETAQGLEYAEVAGENIEVPDSEVVQPIKPVLRIATEKDEAQHKSLEEMNKKAMEIAEEKVSARKLQLKLIRAEYGFDMKKVVIFFSADGRVDFRELVKDLASALRTRIELKQIYERDEFKLMGTLAICGRPCCCLNHMRDFGKVSIKMAKLQGLSLNPTKINGACGKLMCCLAYENEVYKEVFSEMPKIKSKVITPEGEGIVDENYPLTKKVKVKFYVDDVYHFTTYKLDEVKTLVKQTIKDVGADSDTEE